MPTGQTDGKTDGRTPDCYITLSARRGQRNASSKCTVGYKVGYSAVCIWQEKNANITNNSSSISYRSQCSLSSVRSIVIIVSVRLFVCQLAYLKNLMSKFHLIFCIHVTRGRLLMTAMRDVMYFRFCEKLSPNGRGHCRGT